MALIPATTTRNGPIVITEQYARVIALVPAYNEEEIIERTIESLMIQTFELEYVLVIANNCKDRTADIVRELQQVYGTDKLRLEVMDHNPDLKSGALNRGYQLIKDPGIDYVFCMDSDTFLDERIIEMGLKKFSIEPNTGGICSAYRTLPLEADTTRWQRFLWRAQNIEFSLANAWRIENIDSTRVLPGVATLYRRECLEHVRKNNLSYGLPDFTIWKPSSQVEDYDLTLQMKDLTWNTKSCHSMICYSDVPLKLNGKGGLWQQRRRWYSGTVDTLRQRGLAKNSRYELFTISMMMVSLISRVALVAMYALLLMSGMVFQFATIFLLLPVIAILIQLQRVKKYGDQLDRWQWFFCATLVVNEAYAIYREILYAYAIWLSYFRPNRAW